jgi:hypothetical protein
MSYGAGAQVCGGGDADSEHACVSAAVEHRNGADRVPSPTGPPVPRSCAPAGVADPPSRLLRVVTDPDPTRRVILRC